MSAPYGDEPLPIDDLRLCMVCLRYGCPGHRPLTADQIFDAYADGVAPFHLCWDAVGPVGRARDIARAEIAKLIAGAMRS